MNNSLISSTTKMDITFSIIDSTELENIIVKINNKSVDHTIKIKDSKLEISFFDNKVSLIFNDIKDYI